MGARFGQAALWCARRLAIMVGMLLVVATIVFLITQALPGDLPRQILGQAATDAQIARLSEQMGLDRPLIVQYFEWLGGMLRGDLGVSLASGTPVATLMGPRIAATAFMVTVAAAITLPAAFALGIAAARRPGGALDHAISGTVFVIMSMPEFVIAIALVAILATNVFHVLPATAALDPRIPIWDQANLIVLPLIAMVITALPHLTESVKATVREELSSEHVRWARLSGIPERTVLTRYALANVVPPSLQICVQTVGYLIGGTIAIETVFSFPGIGSGLANSVMTRDITSIQSIAVLIAAVLIALYAVADAVGLVFTPRARRPVGGNR
ncbi:MAG: ABC transporter permease [Bifidobacteriaceae bacterium]|jgi:peptide/nickel transport system permease protein|nr:ABC transporter permease [Bifidobacteriaceae bacterium]